MPGPVGRESQNTVAEPLDHPIDATSSTHPQQPKRQAQDFGNSVESFQCGIDQGRVEVASQEDTLSIQELQHQLAQAGRREVVAREAFNGMQPELANAINATGSYKDVSSLDYRLMSPLTSSPEFKRALAELSREELVGELTKQVRQQRPLASPAEVKEIVQRLTRHIEQHVLIETGKRTSEAVKATLSQAADRFDATAKDPAQITAICKHLAKLESLAQTPEQKKESVALRAALGLPNDDRQVTPTALQDALHQRAALMRHEGNRVLMAGEPTMYRNLMLHSGLNEKFAEERGVKPGSWAAQGYEAVMARGESDEHSIETAKLASSVAVAMLGVGNRGVDMGKAALFGSIGVMTAAHELEAAQAGLSGGTADLSAEEAAQRKLDLAQTALVTSVVTTGVMPHAHGVMAPGVNALREGAAEFLIGKTEQVIEKGGRPAKQGVQGDGVTRALRSAR